MLGGKRRRLKQWPLDSYLSPLSGPAQGQGGGKWAGNHVPPGLRQERGQPCKAPGRSEAGETGIEYGTSRSVPTLTPGHGPNVRNVPKALGGRWLLSLVRKSRWGLSLLSKLSSRACPIHLNSSGDSVSETPPGDAGHSAACRGHPNGSTPGTLPGPHEDTRCRGGATVQPGVLTGGRNSCCSMPCQGAWASWMAPCRAPCTGVLGLGPP